MNQEKLKKISDKNKVMRKQLAKITSAKLSLQEKGILTFWIFVEYEDYGNQGIGGFCLDDFNKEQNKRIGTAYGCEMIRMLLKTLNVDDLSESIGQIIWVHGKGKGLRFEPKGISQLKVNNSKSKPFIFNDIYNEFVLKK